MAIKTIPLHLSSKASIPINIVGVDLHTLKVSTKQDVPQHGLLPIVVTVAPTIAVVQVMIFNVDLAVKWPEKMRCLNVSPSELIHLQVDQGSMLEGQYVPQFRQQ